MGLVGFLGGGRGEGAKGDLVLLGERNWEKSRAASTGAKGLRASLSKTWDGRSSTFVIIGLQRTILEEEKWIWRETSMEAKFEEKKNEKKNELE